MVEERYNLAVETEFAISEERTVDMKFRDYFIKKFNLIDGIGHTFDGMQIEELAAWNQLYSDILPNITGRAMQIRIMRWRSWRSVWKHTQCAVCGNNPAMVCKEKKTEYLDILFELYRII